MVSLREIGNLVYIQKDNQTILNGITLDNLKRNTVEGESTLLKECVRLIR